MARFILLFFCVSVWGCSIDRQPISIPNSFYPLLDHFRSLPERHQLQITDSTEFGQPLWLCLTIVDKANKAPLVQQVVHLYHTSHVGEYEPSDPHDESTARLSGTVLTNSSGEVFVQTILPGDYGSSHDNRHIHTTVANAQPEAYDIHFKQYSGAIGTNFIERSDQHFLADLRIMPDSTLLSFVTIEVKNPAVNPTPKRPECEWCGAKEAPTTISHEGQIAPDQEPGVPLILTGTVFLPDGKTPAPNVIIYAYQTNAEGIYPKRGNEIGNGVRHGYLRGWVKTNEDGIYKFRTIKPSPYPSRSDPAHIHMTLMGDDFDEYWIASTLFHGDSLINQALIDELSASGDASSIIELKTTNNGTLEGNRNIVLAPRVDR